jgi:hypothetical protein
MVGATSKKTGKNQLLRMCAETKARSSGVQEFRSSGVQEFRSSGVQEFRSSGVQEFRSSGVRVGSHSRLQAETVGSKRGFA